MRPDIVVVALVLNACIITPVSSTDTGGGGHCAERTGNYLAHFVEQSGTCGPLADQVLAIQSQQTAQMLPAGCTGTVIPSADNCTVQLDTTCPGAIGNHVTQRGQSTWSTDAASGNATLQIIMTLDPDGTVTCSSVYGVAYARL